MAIVTKTSKRPTIDLDGPDGNAFVLLGTAKSLAKKLELNSAEIVSEMMASDYQNLIKVFDKYFGKYIDLETSDPSLLNLLEQPSGRDLLKASLKF